MHASLYSDQLGEAIEMSSIMGIGMDVVVKKPVIEPTYWFSTGPAAAVFTVMVKTFAAYARSATYIKVGITRSPELRLRAHQREWFEGHEWERMIVVYRSSSWQSVCRIETMLIAYARARGWGDKLYNQVAGGGGRVPKIGPYWVYLLTDSKTYR